ncbi:MAG: serine/threonine protein kinase [Planctomycetes bacterium]|nr:serine/threonine protein kinase [Planctomycetota bacterium]
MSTGNNSVANIIEGYEILQKLGQGGMGAVYMARQKSMDRVVALKILPRALARRADFKERFFREAKAAGKLNHQNIVTAIDANESNGYCYIAMEYVEGETVAAKIKRVGKLSETECISIAKQIASALAHAWSANIVHRDVKPENFLYTNDGVAKLCDLGIAKAPSDAGLTQEGTALGTPRYIAPEQARGLPDIDFRSDIYSLGASMFHMVAGEPPFDGPTAAAIMIQHINEPLPPLRDYNPEASDYLAAVIEKMMAKAPEKRYQDSESLMQDLSSVNAGNRPVHAVGKKVSERKLKTSVKRPVSFDKRRSRGNNNNIAMYVIGAIILVVALAFMMKKNDLNDPVAAPVDQPSPHNNQANTAVQPPIQLDNHAADIKIAFIEAQEFDKSKATSKALASYIAIEKKWPDSQYSSKCKERIAALRAEIAGASASEEIKKKNKDAEIQFLKLKLSKDELSREKYIDALTQFRTKWANTPSCDQAWAEIRSVQDEIAAEERIKTALTPENSKKPLANSTDEAKAILTDAKDWKTIEQIIDATIKAEGTLYQLVPEIRALATTAPKYLIREKAFQAVVSHGDDWGLALDMLKDRNENIRSDACDFFRQYPHAEAADALNQLVGAKGELNADPSPRVRNQARRALQALGEANK